MGSAYVSAEEDAIDLSVRVGTRNVSDTQAIAVSTFQKVGSEVSIHRISSHTLVGKWVQFLLFLSRVSGIIMVWRSIYVLRKMKVVGELDMPMLAMS